MAAFTAACNFRRHDGRGLNHRDRDRPQNDASHVSLDLIEQEGGDGIHREHPSEAHHAAKCDRAPAAEPDAASPAEPHAGSGDRGHGGKVGQDGGDHRSDQARARQHCGDCTAIGGEGQQRSKQSRAVKLPDGLGDGDKHSGRQKHHELQGCQAKGQQSPPAGSSILKNPASTGAEMAMARRPTRPAQL